MKSKLTFYQYDTVMCRIDRWFHHVGKHQRLHRVYVLTYPRENSPRALFNVYVSWFYCAISGLFVLHLFIFYLFRPRLCTLATHDLHSLFIDYRCVGWSFKFLCFNFVFFFSPLLLFLLLLLFVSYTNLFAHLCLFVMFPRFPSNFWYSLNTLYTFSPSVHSLLCLPYIFSLHQLIFAIHLHLITFGFV